MGLICHLVPCTACLWDHHFTGGSRGEEAETKHRRLTVDMLRKSPAGAESFNVKRAKLAAAGEEGPHVKWDEETIAEHDKERGTRQVIDEPDTPFRYGEDDDYGEELQLTRGIPMAMAGAGTEGGISIPGAGANRSNSSSAVMGESPQAYATSPSAQPGDNVMDVWEILRAKLYHEQQQQQQRQDSACTCRDKSIGTDTAAKSSTHSGTANAGMEAMDMEAGLGADTGEAEADTGPAMTTETVGFDHEPAPATDKFKKARSAHYNEFQLMKAMAARLAAEEEDEDED